MRRDVVRNDLQSVVPVPKAPEGRIHRPDHEMAGIPGQGVGAFTAQLEDKLPAVQALHSERVVQCQCQPKAVVARPEVGARGGNPDSDLLPGLDGGQLGGLRQRGFHGYLSSSPSSAATVTTSLETLTG